MEPEGLSPHSQAPPPAPVLNQINLVGAPILLFEYPSQSVLSPIYD